MSVTTIVHWLISESVCLLFIWLAAAHAERPWSEPIYHKKIGAIVEFSTCENKHSNDDRKGNTWCDEVRYIKTTRRKTRRAWIKSRACPSPLRNSHHCWRLTATRKLPFVCFLAKETKISNHTDSLISTRTCDVAQLIIPNLFIWKRLKLPLEVKERMFM